MAWATFSMAANEMQDADRYCPNPQGFGRMVSLRFASNEEAHGQASSNPSQEGRRATGDRHAQADRRRPGREARDNEEAGRGDAERHGGRHHQAPEEGSPHPPDRPGHPAGAQARRADGPQPGNRRGDQDQGEQEDRIPRLEGTEGDRLSNGSCAVWHRALGGGRWTRLPSCGALFCGSVAWFPTIPGRRADKNTPPPLEGGGWGRGWCGTAPPPPPPPPRGGGGFFFPPPPLF